MVVRLVALPFMRASQSILVPKVKVPVIPKVLMVGVDLATIKREVMGGIIVVPMLRKVEPNVPGVMTSGKPKSLPIKVFESSGD
jgi:hypothetical protein